MKWVSGFRRDSGGQLLARVQSWHGHEQLSRLTELSADLEVEGVRPRRRMLVDLSKAVEADTAEYLSLLGLAHLPATGQAVYEFQSEVGRLLVPAQLLVFATIGSQFPLRYELLSPQGPTALMTPVIGPFGLSMEPTPSRNRPYDLQPEWNAPRLEWIQCYPSVRKAWASVYANALRGRLAISAMRAMCEVNVKGLRAADGTFLVTSLKLTEATPSEEPFDFAAGRAAKSYVFDSKKLATRTGPRGARAPRKEASLEGVAWTGAMTDEQWTAVERVLVAPLKLDRPEVGRAKRKYEVRELVDVMVEKCISGVPWPQAHTDSNRVRAAIELFYRLTKAGVWTQVMHVLAGDGSRQR
jgi:hypothetical protein